jgi:hypothetical protein
LLANEGRLLIYAAAQLGHSYVAMTGRYSHLFKNSDLAHRTPIADAITSARAKVAGENARSECDQDSGGVDETAPETTETPALAGVSWDGRYWARTSDPQLVELVLSQLS